MLTKETIVPWVAVAIIVTGLNVLVTKYLMGQQRQAIVHLLSEQAPVLVMDGHALIAKMERDGMNRAEQLAHLDNITRVLNAQGTLVLDKTAVISLNDAVLVPYAEPHVIGQLLERHQLPKSTADEFQDHLMSAEQWLQQQMNAN